MRDEFQNTVAAIKGCTLCAEQFGRTKTAHAPRPVVWLSPAATVLIAGQAPGARVQASGRPFTDPSGDRLRDWLGVDKAAFYDTNRFAILPMAFCFPGYNAAGADLPPPSVCAATWREKVLNLMPEVRLTLVIGGYAQKWHLKRGNVRQTVRDWRAFGPEVIPLPHPSWHNTGWFRKNPWFEAELLPILRQRVAARGR